MALRDRMINSVLCIVRSLIELALTDDRIWQEQKGNSAASVLNDAGYKFISRRWAPLEIRKTRVGTVLVPPQWHKSSLEETGV